MLDINLSFHPEHGLDQLHSSHLPACRYHLPNNTIYTYNPLHAHIAFHDSPPVTPLTIGPIPTWHNSLKTENGGSTLASAWDSDLALGTLSHHLEHAEWLRERGACHAC